MINNALLPVKLIIPQPIVARIPGLTTNEDIRISMVLGEVRGRLLDIGCGNNRMVKTYRALGGKGIGVDVFPWDGADLVVPDTSRLDFPDAHFDTITFVACLNHIPNRLAVLAEAKRLLAKDGHVIVTNLHPFVSKTWHKIAFWDKDQSVRGMKKGEVWGFKQAALLVLFGGTGFRLEKKIPFSWGVNTLMVFSKNFKP